MEKLLKYFAEQNKAFDPHDRLSKLIDETLSSVRDELNEEELEFVQAARGPEGFDPDKSGKEKKSP